jgi:hypothetical protein
MAKLQVAAKCNLKNQTSKRHTYPQDIGSLSYLIALCQAIPIKKTPMI